MLSKLEVPIPPLVLALILGGMTEQTFRNAMTISDGNLATFFVKPISLTLLILAVISLLYALRKHRKITGIPS